MSDAAQQPPKPREFWLAAKADGQLEAFEFPCGDMSGWYRAVHVIEKSAYYVLYQKYLSHDMEVIPRLEQERDAALAELEELKTHLALQSEGWKTEFKSKEVIDALRDELTGFIADLMAMSLERDQLRAENEHRRQKSNAEIKVLREENERLKETLSYLPKPPTEPHEKAMAKEILRLREALEKYPCTCQTTLLEVKAAHPQLKCFRCRALEQSE